MMSASDPISLAKCDLSDVAEEPGPNSWRRNSSTHLCMSMSIVHVMYAAHVRVCGCIVTCTVSFLSSCSTYGPKRAHAPCSAMMVLVMMMVMCVCVCVRMCACVDNSMSLHMKCFS